LSFSVFSLREPNCRQPGNTQRRSQIGSIGQVASCVRRRLARSTRPPAGVLSTSPAPGVIRSTASHRFGNEAIHTSLAKRRRRAPERLRTRLSPIPCGRGLTDAGRNLADAALALQRSPGHLAQPEALPAAFYARRQYRSRPDVCACRFSAKPEICLQRPRRVRAHVIRGDGKPPGLMPRTTVRRVPPYATRQR
jgi:hypothetical protein